MANSCRYTAIWFFQSTYAGFTGSHCDGWANSASIPKELVIVEMANVVGIVPTTPTTGTFAANVMAGSPMTPSAVTPSTSTGYCVTTPAHEPGRFQTLRKHSTATTMAHVAQYAERGPSLQSGDGCPDIAGSSDFTYRRRGSEPCDCLTYAGAGAYRTQRSSGQQADDGDAGRSLGPALKVSEGRGTYGIEAQRHDLLLYLRRHART
jgi:hypothetical protein